MAPTLSPGPVKDIAKVVAQFFRGRGLGLPDWTKDPLDIVDANLRDRQGPDNREGVVFKDRPPLPGIFLARKFLPLDPLGGLGSAPERLLVVV